MQKLNTTWWQNAPILRCDVCDEPVVGGGFMMPRGPVGEFCPIMTNLCSSVECLGVWMKAQECWDDETLPEEGE